MLSGTTDTTGVQGSEIIDTVERYLRLRNCRPRLLCNCECCRKNHSTVPRGLYQSSRISQKRSSLKRSVGYRPSLSKSKARRDNARLVAVHSSLTEPSVKHAMPILTPLTSCTHGQSMMNLAQRGQSALSLILAAPLGILEYGHDTYRPLVVEPSAGPLNKEVPFVSYSEERIANQTTR